MEQVGNSRDTIPISQVLDALDRFARNRVMSPAPSPTPALALPPRRLFSLGGERGIRTPGTVTCSTVFETAPFNRSGISPRPACLRPRRPKPVTFPLLPLKLYLCLHYSLFSVSHFGFRTSDFGFRISPPQPPEKHPQHLPAPLSQHPTPHLRTMVERPDSKDVEY